MEKVLYFYRDVSEKTKKQKKRYFSPVHFITSNWYIFIKQIKVNHLLLTFKLYKCILAIAMLQTFVILKCNCFSESELPPVPTFPALTR